MTENKIQVFTNKEFGEIRTVEIDGQPWFVLKDACDILGLSSPHKVAQRLDKDEKGRSSIPTLGGNQTLTVINESGLYAVILRSDKPNARAFRKWLTADVIPCIRKHGGYITEQLLEQLADCEAERDNFIKKLAQSQKQHLKTVKDFKKTIKSVKEDIAELKEENEILETCVEAILPKAEYCDIILQCENSIPVSIIAKGYGMTAIKFNRLLHKVGIQYKLSGTWLLYKKYDGCGFTETNTYRTDSGTAVVHTRWTQSGRRLIYDVLMSCGIFPDCEKYGEDRLC